jgi:hypothetical protein
MKDMWLDRFQANQYMFNSLILLAEKQQIPTLMLLAEKQQIPI